MAELSSLINSKQATDRQHRDREPRGSNSIFYKADSSSDAYCNHNQKLFKESFLKTPFLLTYACQRPVTKSKLVPGLQSEQRQLGDIASKVFHDISFVILMFPTI